MAEGKENTVLDLIDENNKLASEVLDEIDKVTRLALEQPTKEEVTPEKANVLDEAIDRLMTLRGKLRAAVEYIRLGIVAKIIPR